MTKKTHLAQPMSPRKPQASTTLHQPSSGDTIRTSGRDDPDITVALLHDDGKNHTLIDTKLGRLADGDVDAADVVPCVACGFHGILVALEEVVE